MLLSLHTCGTTGSLALGLINQDSTAARILAQAVLPSRSYAAQLNARVSELLAAQRATVGDLQAIIVVRGPGSFTGIRVGLSAAKGLAQGAGIPLIALSHLELIAGVSELPHVLATVDAGRGDYYVGEYRESRKIMEGLLSHAEMVAALRQPGAGVLVYQQVFEDTSGVSKTTQNLLSEQRGEQATLPENPLAPYRPLYVQAPDAADALRFALARFRAGLFEDVASLDANYLRRPDAELAGALGQKALSAI
jgi:tRNA threonylcarbamoyladenosine biosynthesis protein TsaB